ncbi:MAG: UDP-3-O-(3-hydroxymyristoyl)glucosamine N-acyltransferase [Rhodospirillales bacterium 20-60-12]|nr:MAG: UDP-3-O-(3-hydroxymyristoyl)glucosamine N-acyltransferase [Rhodospirillales bacterium 20-60-12]HQT68343.1 UDP-3-O-(3-hydroxymyristoyl)glucosamine N-acyltransferase [Acetobacteraceae bacterium]HQU01124.1 UDP-3-O-(3-hydroxymyristoyl)glucosamine N-acyltransferase [Acetobacteraceae bacterium]
MSGKSMPGDKRFFASTGPYRLAELAATLGLDPPADPACLISSIAPLQIAGPGQISFLDNRRYASALGTCRASAVIVHPDMAARVPASCIALMTREPYLAWATIARLFHPEPPGQPGIHPSAVIGADAHIAPDAEIGPGAVIGAGAEIGARSVIGALSVVGPGVIIGADCRIHPHVTLTHAILGDRVVLHPGVRVGQAGFGFAVSKTGFIGVPQLGRVLLGDDVDVGANTTIDRGSANDTIIGAGSRLDNLVQIGHNVELGRACVVVACAAISGSTIVEDQVMIGGQAAFAGHLRIGKGAQIGAQAGVINDVPAGAKMLGSPAQPIRSFFREVAILRRLARKPGAHGDQN